MIKVVITDEGEGVRIDACGHAEDGCGDVEKYQVCSAVSTFLVTLVTLTSGVWDGEGSGYATCCVPKEHLRLAEFVTVGLQMIQDGYPEHIILERRDTRLFVTEDIQKWSRISSPPEPPGR